MYQLRCLRSTVLILVVAVMSMCAVPSTYAATNFEGSVLTLSHLGVLASPTDTTTQERQPVLSFG